MLEFTIVLTEGLVKDRTYEGTRWKEIYVNREKRPNISLKKLNIINLPPCCSHCFDGVDVDGF
jgi:hypothetical protein